MNSSPITDHSSLSLPEDVVLSARGVSKKFCRNLKRSMLYGMKDLSQNLFGLTSGGATGLAAPLRRDEFWALQDVSFELKKGEAIGIIGTNGSGKSTLLRILAGIFPPDRGDIAIRGRIGALIAVGAGFHPHMTGRENIHLNGSILGMTRREISTRFNEIVEYADLSEFIDAPVATYSSGMTVRLGFSIAVHAKTSILLADEVLAVGDLNFMLKCFRKIAEYRRDGGSIIFVSHAMQVVRNVCQSVLWIDKGVVQQLGATQDVCNAYENHLLMQRGKDVVERGTRILHDPTAQIKSVSFLNSGGESISSCCVGSPITVRLEFECMRRVPKPIVTVSLLTAENILVIANYSNYDAPTALGEISGHGWIDFSISNLSIKPGQYDLTITLSENTLDSVLDWHERVHSLAVEHGDKLMFGLLQPTAKWSLKLE